MRHVITFFICLCQSWIFLTQCEIFNWPHWKFVIQIQIQNQNKSVRNGRVRYLFWMSLSSLLTKKKKKQRHTKTAIQSVASVCWLIEIAKTFATCCRWDVVYFLFFLSNFSLSIFKKYNNFIGCVCVFVILVVISLELHSPIYCIVGDFVRRTHNFFSFRFFLRSFDSISLLLLFELGQV